MIIIKVILWIIAILVALFILGWLNAIRASMSRNKKLDEKIKPAIQAIASNAPDAQSIILKFAEDPSTRNHLFKKLKELGKESLFPMAFRSEEKMAESDLVCWLLHPNELNAAPSEVQMVRSIAVQEGDRTGHVYLFRFLTQPPHWAAGKGWMAGVAGPYWENGEPTESASGTFSELMPFASMSEEEHVDYLRKALYKKGLVVPS